MINEKKTDERILSAHIKDHYQLMTVLPGEMIIDGVTYDFRTITREQADKLYESAKGKRYLKKISETTDAAPAPTGGDAADEKKAGKK